MAIVTDQKAVEKFTDIFSYVSPGANNTAIAAPAAMPASIAKMVRPLSCLV
ncbi:hypothetical protein N824_16805 [Pedobacter sp. V48]|nr:hypothetical protein N824_16805 [Pedobacter sp. V48]